MRKRKFSKKESLVRVVLSLLVLNLFPKKRSRETTGKEERKVWCQIEAKKRGRIKRVGLMWSRFAKNKKKHKVFGNCSADPQTHLIRRVTLRSKETRTGSPRRRKRW